MGVMRSHGRDVVDGQKVFNDPWQCRAVAFMDDFLGDVIEDGWNIDADAGCSGAIEVLAGGVVRLQTDATTSDRVSMAHELNWYGERNAIFECRFKIDAITNVNLFFGFSDAKAEASQLLPMSLSGTTWTTTATDAVGFVFDTAATTDVLYGMGVANGTDATAVQSTSAPVAATYMKLRIELFDGSAAFYIDDVIVGGSTGFLTSTVALTPLIGVQNRTTAARLLDIDYVYLAQDRAA